MTAAAVFVCLLNQAEKVDIPSVEFYQDTFVVRKGSEVERIPLVVTPKPAPMSVLYRRDKTFLVWDDRGLTIRVDDKVRSTRMPELAVSPRLFPREEILRNLARFETKERSKDANALSGSRRIGNEVYLLLRWDDRAGKPWLESLVAVDLSHENPKPRLLGRFDGFTLSRKTIDEQLFIQANRLNAILQKEDNWGIGSYNVLDEAFDFVTLGDKLKQFLPQKWPLARFVEETAYGTTLGGQTHLLDANRKTLAEASGPMRFLDVEDPPLVSLKGPALRNVETGSELKLPAAYGVRRGKFGVLVWAPEKGPTSATLYDPEAWKTLATWTVPGTTPAIKAPGG
jgi:hypothetical protein